MGRVPLQRKKPELANIRMGSIEIASKNDYNLSTTRGRDCPGGHGPSDCRFSARFANVAGEQVVAEIESALKQLLKFLGFDRGTLIQSPAEGKQDILCSVAVEGVELHLPGPIPDSHGWLTKEAYLGRTIVIRSYEDFPPEAAAEAEYYRRVGMRYILVIPLSVGGRVVTSIGFASFRSTREWPDEFIARWRRLRSLDRKSLSERRLILPRASELRTQLRRRAQSLGERRE